MVLTCILHTINHVLLCWWELILPKFCHTPKAEMRVTSLFQMEFHPSLNVKSFLSGTTSITHKNNKENIKYLKASTVSITQKEPDWYIYISYYSIIFNIYIKNLKCIYIQRCFKLPFQVPSSSFFSHAKVHNLKIVYF